MKYVIVRTDQGGGYLQPAGSHKSFSKCLETARTFDSKEAADAECCPENEVAKPLDEIMPN